MTESRRNSVIIAKQKWRHRCKKQTYGLQAVGDEMDLEIEIDIYIYISYSMP